MVDRREKAKERHMKKLILFALLAIMIVGLPALNREFALYNLEDWIRTDNSKLISTRHLLDVAGVPYTEFSSLEECVGYQYIIFSSRISSTSLSSADTSLLESYVQQGGIVIAPRMQDPDLYGVFGIGGYSQLNNRRRLTWQTNTPGYDMLDDPLEQEISLGSNSYEEVISTTDFQVTTGETFALYEDGANAAVRNSYGSGFAYTLGVSFKDVVLMNQLDKDYNANRTYSNGFEPTSDTFFFVIRGIYQLHTPFGVWKYTIPGEKRSAMLITHDVDSQTAMDWCVEFAQMERLNDVSSTYNVTTRYFSDYYIGNMWIPENLDELNQLASYDHMIGSHSVTHAPDFSSTRYFPVGSAGNDTINYRPHYDGEHTAGGTVYGELEVSRDLLVQELGANVMGFRSGHLAFNPMQCNVLDSLGYLFDSSMSANDVLTNFPYFMTYDQSYNGALSNILELPMTISDVGWDEETQQEMYEMWVDITARNARNYAPTNLLIHPNREWKLERERMLIENMSDDILFITMEDYGDFWRQRHQIDFSSYMLGDTLLIVFDSELPERNDLSFVITDGMSLSHVSLQTSIGELIDFTRIYNPNGDLQLIVDPFSVHAPQAFAIPENVTIQQINDDVKLTWDPVTTTIEGEPAVPDYYLVFYSEYPDNDDLFFYHGYTTAAQYFHYGVLQFADSMYYRVVAYKRPPRSRRNVPGDLIPGETSLTRFLDR